MESDTSNTRTCFSCDWARPAAKGQLNKHPLNERGHPVGWQLAAGASSLLLLLRTPWGHVQHGTVWRTMRLHQLLVKTTTPKYQKTLINRHSCASLTLSYLFFKQHLELIGALVSILQCLHYVTDIDRRWSSWNTFRFKGLITNRAWSCSHAPHTFWIYS